MNLDDDNPCFQKYCLLFKLKELMWCGYLPTKHFTENDSIEDITFEIARGEKKFYKKELISQFLLLLKIKHKLELECCQD